MATTQRVADDIYEKCGVYLSKILNLTIALHQFILTTFSRPRNIMHIIRVCTIQTH